MTIIYIIIAIVIVWTTWGYFSSRVEQTPYSVLEKKRDYEIRLYPEHLVAETIVKGPYQEALNEGFRIIAKYIFGNNTTQKSIAMTAPVIEGRVSGEKIAMTAPVIASAMGDSHVIAFGMPKSYTRETLPQPLDPRVKIVTIPEKKMAVIRFSGLRSPARVEAKKGQLLQILNRDQITPRGEPQYAGYNAPWTPPWFRRDEVLVEI